MGLILKPGMYTGELREPKDKDTEPRPCPFCGGKAAVEFWSAKGGRPAGYHVECEHDDQCYLSGGYFIYYGSKVRCVEDWNRSKGTNMTDKTVKDELDSMKRGWSSILPLICELDSATRQKILTTYDKARAYPRQDEKVEVRHEPESEEENVFNKIAGKVTGIIEKIAGDFVKSLDETFAKYQKQSQPAKPVDVPSSTPIKVVTLAKIAKETKYSKDKLFYYLKLLGINAKVLGRDKCLTDEQAEFLREMTRFLDSGYRPAEAAKKTLQTKGFKVK